MIASTWVVGAGGLLGSNVLRALRSDPEVGVLWQPASRLPWRDSLGLRVAFADGIRAVLAAAAARGRHWSIVWCAGEGVVASPEQAHARDTDVWQIFLDQLNAAHSSRDSMPTGGLLVLASSAGGVWANASDRPISDATPVAPASTYGRAHVAREQRLATFLAEHESVGGIVVRLTNLYGPGQSLDKPQGLISQIGRCVLHRRPVHIYVPLDTARDYLFAEDAGRAIAELVRHSPPEATGTRVHVVASGRSTTISGLLAVFSRVVRRRIPVTVGLHSASPLQPLCLSFRPSPLDALGVELLMPLEEGVARLFREQMSLLEAGRLSSPAIPQDQPMNCTEVPLAGSDAP